jgi:hypothetical protein
MWFLLILAAAAGARVWYLSTWADNARTDGLAQVQDALPVLTGPPPGTELNALIENWKEHRWFGSRAPFAGAEEQTAHASPGYPWLLAELTRIPAEPEPLVRWIQCGLGALTAALYFLFARRAFGSRLVSVLTGAFCAFYPFWVVNTAELNDGVVATFLVALALWLGGRGGQEGGAFTSVLYGLTLAAMSLVRAPLLLFAFAALLWFLLRCRSLRAGWLYALLAFLGFAGGLAPWTVRNFQVHGDVVPIVNSAYLHLWMGNHPGATGGPEKERTLLEALAKARQEDVQTTTKQLADLRQQERYQGLGQEVVQAIRTDPAGTVERRLWAGLFFFFGEDWITKHRLWRSEQTVEEPVPLLFMASLYGMLLLGVLGWRWTYGWRREAMPSSLAVFWIPLPYLLSHAEALSGPRLPLDGVLLCYAAFALICLVVPTTGRILFQGGEAEHGRGERG